MLGRIFFESPRCRVFHVAVRLIGKFHDDARRAGVVELFVCGCNAFTGSGSGCEQSTIVWVLNRQSHGLNEAGRTTC